jgi:N-acetylmuramic acid 6-phosphate etherase
VRGALQRAKKRGARTVLITANASRDLSKLAEIVVRLDVGPEVIAGSSRLKAGTATKLALNQITTSAFVSSGKVYGPWMVDLRRGSAKLKDRARRIVNIVTGLEYEEADKLLKKAHWNVKAAIVMQKTQLPYLKALSRLRKAHDSIREALGEDIEGRLCELVDGHMLEPTGLPRP